MENILLVDDNADARILIAELLASKGYEVAQAENAGEALEVYQKNADKIRLLVTDIVLPDASGIDLSVRIALINPAVRTLYISGHSADSIAGLPENAVMLKKPFSPDALILKIREILDGRGKA